MKITEQDLQKMIRNGLHKAFSQNGQFGTDGTENFISLMNAKNMVETEDELEEEKGYSPFLKSDENPKGETEGLTTDVLNRILMNIIQDEDGEGGETTEAMGAGASGAFSAPLFSEPKKNNLFQPGTESKLTTKPEGGPVNEQEEEDVEVSDETEGLGYDFYKGVYEPETKSYVGSYLVGEETPKQLEVYNIIEKPDRDAIYASNHVPYSMSLHKIKLPTSQVEILGDVPGKDGFKFIRIPYWLFKKDDGLRIQRLNEKKALYLKGRDRTPESLEKLFDPMFEKYFEQIVYDEVDQRKYDVAKSNHRHFNKSMNEDTIPGGKADGMDIEDIAEMHGVDMDIMYDEFAKGVQHEMEHTSEPKVAVEIALDHLYEDPEYYTKLEGIEKSGGETSEVTSSSSAGVYDAPFGGPKKDPLKLSNPDTVEKELRSVRDKNFPKYGGKGAKFVKIKKKCSKFPYCNQGDINALQLFERDIVKEMVTRTAKTAKVEEYVIRNIIAKELGYIQEQEDGEYVTFEFPDDYKPKSAEEHRKEWMDSIKDKRAKFLIDKFEGKEIEFRGKDLTGKIKIISIGPSDAHLGFASSADDYNFENGDGVKIVYDLIDLYYKGDKVPNGFYSMMSRYLPPEEEEDSYRGDPVEYAVMGGLDEIISALKYMGLRFEKAEINPWSHY